MSGSQDRQQNNSDAHRMHILSQGQLEDITLPASSKARSGYRPQGLTSSASSTSYASRLNSSIPPNIQLLDPDEIIENNYDLELEDLASSDYTDESDEDGAMGITGRTESIFGIAEPLTDSSKTAVTQFDRQSEQSEDDYLAIRQLALLENESDDISMCSEEEQDIMAEIRAEITEKVRDEMKSELKLYQQAKDNLNKDTAAHATDEHLIGVDPKLKEAIIKMRKLDKILEKRMKREKQVKRDRIQLQKRLHDELANLRSESQKKITVDEQRNTEKFMSLALPPSHNAGIFLEQQEEDLPDVTPVFQTQLPDDIGLHGAEGDKSLAQFQTEIGGQSVCGGDNQSGTSSVSGISSMTTDSNGKKMRRKKKDFIQRNKQLASDAANAIAMTDDEKKRVQELLTDIDTLAEVPQDDSSLQSNTPNPFQVAIFPGDGFTPTPSERERLNHIDMRLQSLMPPDDYLAISSGSTSHLSNSTNTDYMLFTRTHMSSLNSGLDLGNDHELGEATLKDTKEQREQQERLKSIEEELGTLTNVVQLEMESPSLTDDQLNLLLDDCARTMSRATQETTSMATSRSSRVSIYDKPPVLPDDVLQQLLQQARKELTGDDEVTDTSITSRHDDMMLESFSEESTNRDTLSSCDIKSQLSSQASLLRIKHASPQRCYSPQIYQSNHNHMERRPFLPEIDPIGRLSTQRPNNDCMNNERYNPNSRPTSRSLSSVYTVRNSLNNGQDLSSNLDCAISQEEDDDTPTSSPHPPASTRKSNSAGRNKTRYP